MKALAALAGAGLLAAAAPASAQSEEAPRRPIQAGARLGYALPLGSYEHGTAASDLSFGSAVLGLDGAYSLGRVVSLGGLARLGFGIPKACSTSGDCTSSLGRDVSLLALARFELGAFGRFVADAEAGLGYAWVTRRSSDDGTVSSRSYHGPVWVHAAVLPALRLGARARLALAVEADIGTALRTSLDAPGVDDARNADGPTLNAQVLLGLRGSFAFLPAPAPQRSVGSTCARPALRPWGRMVCRRAASVGA